MLLLTVACGDDGYLDADIPDAALDTDAQDQTDSYGPDFDAWDPQDAADPTSSHPDATPGPDSTGEPDTNDDISPPVQGVEVSHERELRGVWIPTVFNMSWPRSSGMSQSAQKEQLDNLLKVARDAGLNTVFFQIRAEADAFYPSNIEPWSRFISGTMGVDPGWDPLEFAIEKSHEYGLELHAWLNPYRALSSASSSLASSDHILWANPSLVVRYGDFHWMDPGLEGGRQQTLDVVEDVLTRYDVDGIHFDDYFYPYPEPGLPFPDASTYQAYQNAGGTLDLGDFRRDNVNQLMQAVHELIRDLRPDVRFGISPFGIYRPGYPEGITGLDQYDAIYADPLAWLEGGWVDYIAPQLYWPTTQTAQAYGRLLDWWADQASAAGKDLYVGNFTNKLGENSDWTVPELVEQVRLTRAARDNRSLGNIHFHINPIQENRSGLTTALVEEFYGKPAAAPPIPGADGRPEMPEFSVTDEGVRPDTGEGIRYFAVYKNGELFRLIPGTRDQFGLPAGDYVISAIDRMDRESLGYPVTLTTDSDNEEPPSEFGSCDHQNGGHYANKACSGAYQCCNGTWQSGQNSCGQCVCVEPSGEHGCQ